MAEADYREIRDFVYKWSRGNCIVSTSLQPEGMILVRDKQPNGAYKSRQVSLDDLKKEYEGVRDRYHLSTIIMFAIGIALIAVVIFIPK